MDSGNLEGHGMFRLIRSLLAVTLIFIILLQLSSAIDAFVKVHQIDGLSDDASIYSSILPSHIK